jgi:hypothetical protein
MKYLLLFLLFLPTSTFGQGIFDNVFRDAERETQLEDSINVLLDDILFAIELIEQLETDNQRLQQLYEQELQNIKIETVTEEVIVTEVVRDTVRVTQSGVNTDKVFNITFDIINYMNGSVYNMKGYTSFRWDFENNEPIETDTFIDDFQLNLNVETSLVPRGDTFIIQTQPTTPQIRISNNVGNVLTEDDYIRRVPSRLGFGLIGGYGFSYQGVTPYAGIGVTFNFYELSELFRR